MKTKLCVATAAFLTSPAFAEETRELGAHEHGVGALNIAVEGTEIAMAFHAPGADIVGFEYGAKSAEDRAAIDAAIATLAKPLDLFVVPAAAECTVTQASAKLEIEEDDHDDHDHDDHDHDDHAEDNHDDHDHAEDNHDDHDDHEDHAEEASHTEFRADYAMTCANPSAIDQITFAYFDTFENAIELEVQLVSSGGAQAFEVKRDAPTLDLKGMF